MVQLKLTEGFRQRNFKKQISEPVELALGAPAPDMWDRILKNFKQTLEKAEATYLAKAKSTVTIFKVYP